MIVFDLFEQDPNFRKPVEYENRKQYGTVNFANFIKAYEKSQPVQFDFPGAKSYKLTAQWVDLLGDYYNTLETNADKAQLVYGTLTDYNKTIRLLNDLAQSKLFEKKSSDDNLEFKSAKLARLKQQARAKYPAAANDMEALAADFTDSQEADQQELEKVKSINVKQDELLKQINAINQAQDQEIDNLDGENSSLQKNLDQIRAANAELTKKLADMSARRSSKKQKSEPPAVTTSGTDNSVTTTGNVIDPEPESTEPADSAKDTSKSAIPTIVKTVAGAGSQTGTTTDTKNVSVDTNKEMPTLQKANSDNKDSDTKASNVVNFPTLKKQSADSSGQEGDLFARTGTEESINEADAIPRKSVVQGYQVDYNPRTRQVTVSRRGQVIGTGHNRLNSAKYHLTLINKIIDQAEEDKYPTDIDDRDVALPMKRVGEGSVFGQQDFDTQMDLAKLKSQLTQPKPAQSAPASAEPQPVPVRLSDLQSKKQRIDNLASIKQEIEKLQARATRGGRMLPRGLAADLEDYFTTADIDTSYDDMIAKYQKQLGALQQYLGMRKALWSPKKDVHEMKAKELQEGGPETWTVHFTDGTTTRVRVPSDETDPAQVRAFFAKKGKTVKKFDYGFGTEPEAGPGPERHEPGSGTARSARTGEELPEGEVVNINRGGHNAFRDKNDWLDKRDYVQQQLLDPRQRENYPELKQRLLDINSAGRKLGYTK